MSEKKEYVERGAVLKTLRGYSLESPSTLGRHSGVVDVAMEAVELLPAADVAPVVYGEWELFLCDEDAYEHHRCSVCKNLAWFEYENETMWDENIDGEMVECGDVSCGITEHLTPFCPMCGAKMDGGKE